MVNKSKEKPGDKTESDDFESVAKRLECEDDKETFEKKLGKIARTSPMKKGEK